MNKKNKIDFVEKLTRFIVVNIEMVQEEWAQLLAISLLSTFLGEIQIVKKPPVRMNLYILMIALSGTRKSLPIIHVIEKILKIVGKKLNKDFKLPTKSSVEGFIEELTENDQKEGLIIAHEFSGVFKKARETGYQSDALEFMSENYDGIGYKRRTISHGKQELEDVYISILAATTPYFLKKMDEDFFIQGTGNRFLFNYFDIADFKVPSEDEDEMLRDIRAIFSSKGYENYNIMIGQFADDLVIMYKKLHGKDAVLKDLRLSTPAAIEWRKFEIKSLRKWKEVMTNVYNYKGQIINRYPLTALKLAGIFCISRNFWKIINAESKDDVEDVLIETEDMKKAIRTVMKHHQHFEMLMEIKEKGKHTVEVSVSVEERAYTSLRSLMTFPNYMANQSQLSEKQDVTKSPNTLIGYLNVGLKKGWIEEVDKSTIEDSEEKERLNVKTRSKVYRWVQ